MPPPKRSAISGVHRGRITKTGNAHLRRVPVQAVWAYRFRATLATGRCRERQRDQPAPIVATSTKAQLRLCPRYRRLTERAKLPLAAATVIAREWLGFIWASKYAVEPPLPVAPPLTRPPAPVLESRSEGPARKGCAAFQHCDSYSR